MFIRIFLLSLLPPYTTPVNPTHSNLTTDSTLEKPSVTKTVSKSCSYYNPWSVCSSFPSYSRPVQDMLPRCWGHQVRVVRALSWCVFCFVLGFVLVCSLPCLGLDLGRHAYKASPLPLISTHSSFYTFHFDTCFHCVELAIFLIP